MMIVRVYEELGKRIIVTEKKKNTFIKPQASPSLCLVAQKKTASTTSSTTATVKQDRAIA